MSNFQQSEEDPGIGAFRFSLSPAAIRIFAIQLLFLGLLFLPDYSLFHGTFGQAAYSRIANVLSLIMGNPAFYMILMVAAVIYSFSFRMNLDEVAGEAGQVSVGSILFRSLMRITTLYAILFVVSWLFLTYKLMFMGNIYINPLVFRGL